MLGGKFHIQPPSSTSPLNSELPKHPPVCVQEIITVNKGEATPLSSVLVSGEAARIDAAWHADSITSWRNPKHPE